jgi:CDP-diacylglycerol--serine O-phosphatidyltransferase
MKQLPNMITLGNLLCGSAAVVLATLEFAGATEMACLLIFAAAVLDFFDGMVARVVGADSAMGRELDSLADVVSFGLAPSVLVLFTSGTIHHPNPVYWLVPFLLVIGAAWRLARFNIDTEQTVYFKGLPAPANGIFWASVVLWYEATTHRLSPRTLDWGNFASDGTLLVSGERFGSWWLLGSAVFFVLMVSRLKLLNFKPKHLRWQGNQARYTILIGSIALFVAGGIVYGEVHPGIVGSLLLYLIVSLIHYYILKPHEIQSRN